MGAELGVVGCGDVALRLYFPHIRELVEDGKAKLTAVCDNQEKRAERVKKEFGAKGYYTDYLDMLDSADVDIIVNLTPASLHASINIEAVKRGKHIYSEKPIATSIEQADEIIEEAERNNVTVVCAPTVILSPVVQQVKKLISNRTIGKICFARAHGSHGGAGMHAHHYNPYWYYSKDMGGGPLFDTGVYPLQELLYALGPAERVTGFSGLAIPEREISWVEQGVVKIKKLTLDIADNTFILLDWGDACFAAVDSNFCLLASKGPHLEFYGAEGVINVNHWGGSFDNGLPAIEMYLQKKGLAARGWMEPEPEQNIRPPKRPWTGPNGVEHLIDCLNTGEKPLATAEMARHTLEITLALEKAAETGRVQKLRTSF